MDYERYAVAELKKMNKAQKKAKYEEMKKQADYSKEYYGHNGYWAALFDALDTEMRCGK